MSINNINNLPNAGINVNQVGSNAVSNNQSSNALAKGDYDYFSEVGGPALPITAKDQLDGTVDEMVNMIVGKMGL